MTNSDMVSTILNEIGIVFQKIDDSFVTFWKDSKSSEYKIVIFVLDDWFCLSYEIDTDRLKLNDSELLYRNYRYFGLKLAMNNDGNYYLMYQNPVTCINAAAVKGILNQYSRVINDLYYS